MNTQKKVLYVYRCTTCQQRGEVHFDDDSHDGDMTECASCGTLAYLEWDGGVMLTTPGRKAIHAAKFDGENVDASTRLGSTPY